MIYIPRAYALPTEARTFSDSALSFGDHQELVVGASVIYGMYGPEGAHMQGLYDRAAGPDASQPVTEIGEPARQMYRAFLELVRFGIASPHISPELTVQERGALVAGAQWLHERDETPGHVAQVVIRSLHIELSPLLPLRSPVPVSILPSLQPSAAQGYNDVYAGVTRSRNRARWALGALAGAGVRSSYAH